MSFLKLLKVHEYLDELFLQHQEELLKLDVEKALEILKNYERELHLHMRLEEELLLPIYERAGQIPGGPPIFYTGEHRRMREFVARFIMTLAAMGEDQTKLKRRVIALFDEEATFKSLCQHHDERERNILYPALDRVSTEAEMRELTERCVSAHSGLSRHPII